jgi:hypothetical protein
MSLNRKQQGKFVLSCYIYNNIILLFFGLKEFHFSSFCHTNNVAAMISNVICQCDQVEDILLI